MSRTLMRWPAAVERWPLAYHVVLILGVACALRLGAWWVLPYHGFVSDEAEYLAASAWLAQGRNFSFFHQWIWTRPPLYIMFLAAHIRFFGPETVWPIRLSQALLSTLSVGLVLQLTVMLAPAHHKRPAILLAGWMMALCYSLVIFAFLLLSETLFITLLLAAVLALTIWAQRSHWRWLILGGVLLGLGALTRAMLAGVLPLFALWVLWQGYRQPAAGQGRQGARAWLTGLQATALLTAVVSSIILPWSFYNTRFFGASSLILIDTTGGYNAMLGAQAAYLEAHPEASACGPEATRCDKMIYNELKNIPDHAERQAAAYAAAGRWIAENPLGFVRKSGRELLDMLWVSYSGDERLSDGYSLGQVPAAHLVGLLWDDTLYVIAAPLALLGLWRTQGRAGKGLVIAWLLYNLVTGPLFFAINRFRLPLLPFLFVYAACALAQLGLRWPSIIRRRLAYGSAALLALTLLPPYAYLPNQWEPNQRRAVLLETVIGLRGLVDAERCAQIEQLIERGDLAAAQQRHDAEDRRKPRTCLALLQAQIFALRGQPDRALNLLQKMDPIPERYLLEGDIYRQIGDLPRAQGAFVSTRLEPQNPTEWAWEHLQPPPAAKIDLGNGLDWGYVDGFFQREYPPEAIDKFAAGFRWTGPVARLRFKGAGTGAAQVLQLRVNGVRPAGQPQAQLEVGTPAGLIESFAVAPEWQTLRVPVPPTPAGEDVVVILRSTTFVPGPEELQARQLARQKLRLLGVQVDWAELVSPK